METLPKLTPTQTLLLRTATRRADGRVIPPANLRGGARVKAMTALRRREWIEAGACRRARHRQTAFKPYRVIHSVLGSQIVVYLIVDGRWDMQSVLARRLQGA